MSQRKTSPRTVGATPNVRLVALRTQLCRSAVMLDAFAFAMQTAGLKDSAELAAKEANAMRKAARDN